MESEANLEIESEKESGISPETRVMLIVAALLISCATHVGLMFACADCEFAPLHGDMKRDRKWTKDLPVMQVRKMDIDPYQEIKTEMARPAAAPDTEKQEERVERLSTAAKSSIVPEMPAAASAASIADAAPEPAKVDPSEWQPREQIATIEAPVVPDDLAALPRVIVPKIERVRGAADITPAYDLMSAPKTVGGGAGENGGLFKSASLVAAVEAEATVAPVPIPAAVPVSGSVASLSDSLGGAGRPTAAQELSAAERQRAEERAAKAADRLNAEKRPVPPAPTTTMVDEKVVASAKEAVRALRDDTTEQGRPFHENVALALGSWIDPARPTRKYFRITISSRAEKPLPVVSKDMVFLLDASGSIGNDRLKSCRKAVSTALRLLNTGDRFNVVAFRDKFTFAFPKTAWRDVSKESLEEADDWLSHLTAHGQTDVFRTLRGVLAMPREPMRPVVALVVTDGDATSGMTRSAEIISKFSELNGGLISIFMYGVKDNANAYLMDMLTRCNRGSWFRHEGLRWAAAAGIPTLALKFQRPVLSDISVIFSASSRVESYPQLVPSLCEDEPIEIFGMCPADQKDIVFSLRGLNGAMVFENMFRLPFGKAGQLDASVKDAWAKQRLYALIAAYTTKADKNLLREIRAFAAEYNQPIPYEKEIK
ncbi:MAG: VWA domain-containing protein [Kiritimatiellia bacterium]